MAVFNFSALADGQAITFDVNADEWMRRADAALYEAKAAGRDRVRVAA